MSSYLLNGSLFTWNFVVKNNSTGVATDVAAVFAYPAAGVTINSTSVSQGSYDVGTDTWYVGTLAPGASRQIIIYGTVTDASLQPFTATGTVSIAEVESNAADNIISRTVGSADPGAACNITGACICGTLPACNFACDGSYEYRLVEGSEVNCTVLLTPGGSYKVTPTSDPADWSFQYTAHCCVSTVGCPDCVNCGETLLQCSIAGSTSLDCAGGQCGAFIHDETGGEAPVPGATPETVPVDPKNGAVVIELYDDVTRFWTYDAVLDTWSYVEQNPCGQMQFCEPYVAVTSNIYTADLCGCTPTTTASHITIDEIHQTGGATSRELSITPILSGMTSTEYDVDWGDGNADLGTASGVASTNLYAAVGVPTQYTITVSEASTDNATSFSIELQADGSILWADGSDIGQGIGTSGTISLDSVNEVFRGCPGSQTADLEISVTVETDSTNGIFAKIQAGVGGMSRTTLMNYDTFAPSTITLLNAWKAGLRTQPLAVDVVASGTTLASIKGTVTIEC